MSNANEKTIFLKDYRPPAFLVDTVDLVIDLRDDVTTVRSTLAVRRNTGVVEGADLVLDGRNLELVSVDLDGLQLTASDHRLDSETLTVFAPPAVFVLHVVTRIRPQDNTALEGLYRSGAMYCTQCEAQGFRKITYFPDRSDVLAVYTTTIHADRDRYPVLLANGNLEETGAGGNGRHWARWRDPFPKPSYLFAMVAGDLALIEDRFITCSDRQVALQIYVEHHNRDKCEHAMHSLRRAMRWDEETFGLEYDLDQYMIVAVDDFNMGAMENKGLNIFNSKYVLARADTATDDDYEGIEAVVAHEYFHNWTGNRVTCRDWFQLSLKEGLTVFRDQLFSADMTSRGVKRIEDVRMLRNRQFPEDSGPMAHPVRPDSYMEINNFYTVTVYEKGAEIVRMLHTLLGEEQFARGLTLYLTRHDGQAATTDDFVRAMEEAGSLDLHRFRLWYSQAGTPELTVASSHDPAAGTYTLRIQQSCPATPGQPDKEPFYLPLVMGLLDKDGREIPLRLAGEPDSAAATTRTLIIDEGRQEFCFQGIDAPPVPSLLRDFSAPVKLSYPYTDEELFVLMAHDRDLFNRWEAGQRLAVRTILALVADVQEGRPLRLDDRFVEVFRDILLDDRIRDKAYVAQLLTLPAEEYIGELMPVIDVPAIHAARRFVRFELARRLRSELMTVYTANLNRQAYRYDPVLAGNRRLKNLCLAYLALLDDQEVQRLCLGQFAEADNMTDVLSALAGLVQTASVAREEPLRKFYAKWRQDPLVLDKWFAVQATAPFAETLQRVRGLMEDPAFSLKNPNRVRSLIGAFCGGNPVAFHAESGEGYRFCADQVLALDALNPQIAARLLGGLSRWRRYDNARQQLMRTELRRVAAASSLSRDVYEVAVKSLGDDG